jgi:hypothetical protein
MVNGSPLATSGFLAAHASTHFSQPVPVPLSLVSSEVSIGSAHQVDPLAWPPPPAALVLDPPAAVVLEPPAAVVLDAAELLAAADDEELAAFVVLELLLLSSPQAAAASPTTDASAATCRTLRWVRTCLFSPLSGCTAVHDHEPPAAGRI